MKKTVLVGLMALLLCGCRAEETFETVSDECIAPVMASPREVSVSLPGEASVPAVESENGRLYLCEDYEVFIQTLDSGDLNATIRTVSGYEAEDLTVMETNLDGISRYEFVWTAAGEDGLQLGRACILDDGAYHYAVTTMAREENSGKLRQTWQDIFDSCRLIAPEVNLSTGS